MKLLLPGKKLKVLVIGGLLLITAAALGVSDTIQERLFWLITTYLGGQAFADGVSGGKTSHTT